MDAAEAAKLKSLLSELDRLCGDAQRLRERIQRVTSEQPLWPPLKSSSVLFDPPTDRPLAVPPEPERSN